MHVLCRTGFASIVAVTMNVLVCSHAAASTGDFNDDGFEDLAVGVPEKDVLVNGEITEQAGEVIVFYGGPNGLRTRGSQVITQEALAIEGSVSGSGDRFGNTLVVGNFDGDAFADLAIGAPNKHTYAGAVYIVFGSKAGLRLDGSSQLIDRDVLGGSSQVPPYALAELGYSLASGRFNHDTWDDLAIGAPGHSILDEYGNVLRDVGAVWILLGSDKGLITAFHQTWTQDSTGVPGRAEAGDRFGSSLAAYQFGFGSEVDLAIGVPKEDLAGPKVTDAGAVNVIYGGGLVGLRGEHAEFFSERTPDVKGTARSLEEWGRVLTGGDLDRDGTFDLVVGSPFETVHQRDSRFGSDPYGEGAVWVLHGSPDGGVTRRDERYNQDSGGVDWIDGIDDSCEFDDWFGVAVTVGDFDGKNGPDLAIGVLEGFGGIPHLTHFDGAVHVLYGDGGALSLENDDFWHQDSPGIKGVRSEKDDFGSALASGDFDGDGFDDLAIGVPGDNVANGDGTVTADCGSISVIYGSPYGLTARDQRLHQNSPGVGGSNVTGDRFGFALAKLF